MDAKTKNIELNGAQSLAVRQMRQAASNLTKLEQHTTDMDRAASRLLLMLSNAIEFGAGYNVTVHAEVFDAANVLRDQDD